MLSLPEDKLSYRYAADKWTVKEIVLHIADDERIYAYDDLLDELATVRAATLSLFNGPGDDTVTRAGVANGNVMSVRAIAYHIAGHEVRHINIIRDRYI